MTIVDEVRTAKTVRVLQIIVGAMCLGAIAFLVVAWFAPMTRKSDQPVLSYLAPAIGLVAVPLSFVLPVIMMGQARRKIAGGELGANLPSNNPVPTEKDQLYGTFSTVTIMGSSLLQGALLLAILAFMIERQSIALATALVLLLLLLARIPTRHRVDVWIEEQTRLIERIRSEQVQGS